MDMFKFKDEYDGYLSCLNFLGKFGHLKPFLGRGKEVPKMQHTNVYGFKVEFEYKSRRCESVENIILLFRQSAVYFIWSMAYPATLLAFREAIATSVYVFVLTMLI